MRRQLDRHPRRSLAGSAVALVLIVIAASVALGGSATAQREVRGAPSLVVVDRSPMTVRGVRFTPRRRVNVTLVAGGMFSRHATPNAKGRFTVTFPAVIDRCTAWSVSASQLHHARVVLSGAKPQCPPA
jgi:hypothetical protein